MSEADEYGPGGIYESGPYAEPPRAEENTDTRESTIRAAINATWFPADEAAGKRQREASRALDALVAERDRYREALERIIEEETEPQRAHPPSVARAALAGGGT